VSDDPADNVRKPSTKYSLTPKQLELVAQKKNPPDEGERMVNGLISDCCEGHR
jgi:hypothetical protein